MLSSKKVPNRTGNKYFDFPVQYRLNSLLPTGVAQSFTFAPFNDIVCVKHTSTNTWVSGLGTVTSANITDPFVTSLLDITSAGLDYNSMRCSEWCVEIIVSGALLNVNSIMRINRWITAPVPLINATTAANGANQWNAIIEDPNTAHIGLGESVQGRCVHTGGIDRAHIEFSPVNKGFTEFRNIYGTVAAPGISNTGVQLPWAPIIIMFDNIATDTSVEFIIRGNYQILPPMGVWTHRLAVEASLGMPEDAWFTLQRRRIHSQVDYIKSKAVTLGPEMSSKAPKVKAKSKPKPKTSTTTTQPRANGYDMARKAIRTAANLARAARVADHVIDTMGLLPPRRNRQRAIDDLRRRR